MQSQTHISDAITCGCTVQVYPGSAQLERATLSNAGTRDSQDNARLGAQRWDGRLGKQSWDARLKAQSRVARLEHEAGTLLSTRRTTLGGETRSIKQVSSCGTRFAAQSWDLRLGAHSWDARLRAQRWDARFS